MLQNIPLFIVNLLLFASFAAAFLTIFFFTYVKNIEKEIVINNTKYITDSLIDNYTILLGKDQKEYIAKLLDNIDINDLTNEDKKVIDENKKLFNKTIKILIIGLIIVLIVTFIICSKYNIKYTDVVIKNLILMVFIGIVEFIFLKYFIRNYLSANINYVKSELIKTIY